MAKTRQLGVFLISPNFLFFKTTSGSRPSGLYILPLNSATPTNLAPAFVKNFAAQYPTCPKPWIINDFPWIP